MSKAGSQEKSAAAEDARARIKRTALKLFSERGIDGVSVRDIVSTAKMRNGASLHYYFGTKEALVEELLLDCARRSDDARLARLDKMEAEGGPSCLADVIRLLIEAELSLDADVAAGQASVVGHTRFIMALQINHRAMVINTFDHGDYTVGYVRCVQHIRNLLRDIPPETLRGRLVLLYVYIISTLATREAYLETHACDTGFWNSPDTINAIVETTCGLLEAPLDLASRT